MLPFLSFFEELDLDDEPTQTRTQERRGGARTLRSRFGGRGGDGDGPNGGARRGGRPSGPQLQRLAALAVAVVVVLGIGVWQIRSCQRNQEVDSYRNFVRDANAVTQASNTVGQQFQRALVKQGQTPQGLTAALDQQIRAQGRAVANAEQLSGPGGMEALRPQLVSAMQYRRNGLEGLRRSLDAAFNSRGANGQIPQEPVNAVAGMYARHVASDDDYRDSYQASATDLLEQEDIRGVRIDDSTFVPTNLLRFADPRQMTQRLVGIAGGTRRGTGGGQTNTNVARGFSLERVVFGPKSQTLEGQRPPITLDLGNEGENFFRATVRNSGEAQETDIEVQVLLNGQREASSRIVVLDQGASETVDIPIDQPEPGEEYTVQVTVVPLANETRRENNTKTYRRVLFGLPTQP